MNAKQRVAYTHFTIYSECITRVQNLLCVDDLKINANYTNLPLLERITLKINKVHDTQTTSNATV